MGISQEAVNLATEVAGLTYLERADDIELGSSGYLDGGLGLRTEASVHPSAVSQPDDLHHLVRRIGQREDDFLFLTRLRFHFAFCILNRTQRRWQRIVIEPASESQTAQTNDKQYAWQHVISLRQLYHLATASGA